MKFSQRELDATRPYKPLDFGNGLVAGSVALDGRLLSLNTYHPEHGYVTLSALAPFPEERRYDQGTVRAYRANLADSATPGFGILPAQPWLETRAGLVEDTLPYSQLYSGQI